MADHPHSAAPLGDATSRIGIIDIGSNSIRLVVYAAPARIPAILLNEKVMAGLGKGLATTGRLDPQAVDRAYTALARFQHLAAAIGVSQLRVVATAAVRDASNGAAFLDHLAGLGLAVTLLSGEEEARMSAEGVLAGIPEADGIVADLGGGSLELADVSGGRVGACASFPLGVLRVGAIRARGPRALRQAVGAALAGGDWERIGQGRPLYLVGGSWRSLARVDMLRTAYPLPIVHHYEMAPGTVARLIRALAHFDRRTIKALAPIAGGRIAALPDAARLLGELGRQLSAAQFIVSAYGLREGVLHSVLPEGVRRADPLICAARDEGALQGRFPEHGELLESWIAPLFGNGAGRDARLRYAACLLGDVGWRAHPDFRAERGLETALHGNWVGIDARGRAMMGQALYTSFGGDGEPAIVARLCTPEERALARAWGLAMRLAQRLSGGVAGPLGASSIAIAGGKLRLALRKQDRALYGEAVQRRHKALAEALGLSPELALG